MLREQISSTFGEQFNPDRLLLAESRQSPGFGYNDCF
jgi:hypothetical protein